jgi:dihydroflavonol-4-reductase
MMALLVLAFFGAEPHLGWTLSVETDPVFWIGTIPNGLAFDANVDLTVSRLPGLRFGVLGFSGLWSGSLGQSVVLPSSFSELDWRVRWSGAGVESQYQFRLGLDRGGLGFGIRLQWNQFRYERAGRIEAQADHFAVTPQVGFQWYPFRKIGFYVLPWAGVQLPVAGTTLVETAEALRETRKILPVVTAHLGWAF